VGWGGERPLATATGVGIVCARYTFNLRERALGCTSIFKECACSSIETFQSWNVVCHRHLTQFR
jgi:hypothetical protein